MREFKLPDVGEGVAEGEIVSWLVEEGDTVSEDQPVAEVETDKALVEIPSPVNGTVREIRAEAGEMVPVGTVIITFDVDGEPRSSSASGETASSDGEETDAEEAPTESEADRSSESSGIDEPGQSEQSGQSAAATGGDEPAPAPGESPEATGNDTAEVATPTGRVFAPPRVRRVAREQGVDLSQVQGSGPGGRVTEADVTAAAAGGEEGATAGSGPESAPSSADTAGTETEPGDAGDSSGTDSTPRAAATAAADRERTLAAPATRRLAREEGVDLDAIPATEERDGEAFVTPEAVREYAQAQREAQEADAAAVSAPGTGGEAMGTDRPEERIPYRGVRKAIGDQMVRSAYTAPHVTHFDDVDVTELVETRTRLKERADEQGIRLTYMPFVMKAATAALEAFPLLNSQLDEEAEEIVQLGYYNLGVAVATDAGLMVPVVEDVDRKGMLQIASEMNELVQRAKDRSISLEEMQGGTFTITNVGGIGGQYATPIINYPEVAILALGSIDERPRVVDGEVVPRHVLTLSLSFDHRVVDGAVAAEFTNTLTEYLRDPELLLLE